jgi:hypothetical protein
MIVLRHLPYFVICILKLIEYTYMYFEQVESNRMLVYFLSPHQYLYSFVGLFTLEMYSIYFGLNCFEE